MAKVVSSEEGDLFGMTFSPDGNYPYYAYRPHGQAQAAIYVLPSLGGTPRLVINNASSGPGFSPDGQHLAFIRDAGKHQVIVIDVNDRNEKVVLEESDFLYRAQPAAGLSRLNTERICNFLTKFATALISTIHHSTSPTKVNNMLKHIRGLAGAIFSEAIERGPRKD